MQKTTVLLILFVFYSSFSYAAAKLKPKCGFEDFLKLSTSIRKIEFSQNQCGVSIDPTYPLTSELIYRSYMFLDDGEFFIFESYGEGSDSEYTASYIYFLFPRKNDITAKLEGDLGVLSIANGSKVSVDMSTARILNFEKMNYEESKNVTREERGGFKIKSYDGILLSVGYKLGGVAYANPKAFSKFIDQKSNYCAIQNDEVFTYDESYHFKFADDINLNKFLETRCPNLDLSTLKK